MEQWAEIRRMHFVERLSIKEIHRRTGRDRKTIRRAVRAAELLATVAHRGLPSSTPSATRSSGCCAWTRVCRASGSAKLIAELGSEGSKTILEDHLRELRPRYLPSRSYQRTLYQPGSSTTPKSSPSKATATRLRDKDLGPAPTALG